MLKTEQKYAYYETSAANILKRPMTLYDHGIII